MIQGLLKGIFLWLYGLILGCFEFASSALLDVFVMDMDYFEKNVPISTTIFEIIVAIGWALLIGNLAFQAMKTMASGIGFEGEDPKILFCRTFVFSFLLLASRPICEIGMSMSKKAIAILKVPNAVIIPSINQDAFILDQSWLLVIIIGLVMIFTVVKLFFQLGERYVIVAVLTMLAPLAFGVGGSKNTEDIFKGWCRMFGAMCLMMVMNVVFLKILLSAIMTVPEGPIVVPWLVFIVAIGKVAGKIDDIISRIGLNTTKAGEPLGSSNIPGMLAMTVSKNLIDNVSKKAAGTAASKAARTTNKSGASMNSTKSRPQTNSSAQGTNSVSNTQNASGTSSQAATQQATSTNATQSSMGGNHTSSAQAMNHANSVAGNVTANAISGAGNGNNSIKDKPNRPPIRPQNSTSSSVSKQGNSTNNGSTGGSSSQGDGSRKTTSNNSSTGGKSSQGESSRKTTSR